MPRCIPKTIQPSHNATRELMITILHHAYLPTPLPCSDVLSLSSFSTFRLNNARSSGLITLASCSSPPTCLPLSVPEVVAWLVDVEEPEPPATPVAGFRCLACGAEGKFPFLSIVSTVRWNLLNRDSARTSVDSRSIVPESSLTTTMSVSAERKDGLLQGPFHLPYLSTSSKCLRCAMIISRCFSSIANAMKIWKLLLR